MKPPKLFWLSSEINIIKNIFQEKVSNQFILARKGTWMDIHGATLYIAMCRSDEPKYEDYLLLESNPFGYYLKIQNDNLLNLVPAERTIPCADTIICKKTSPTRTSEKITRICEIYEGTFACQQKMLVGQFPIEMDSTTDKIRVDVVEYMLQIKTYSSLLSLEEPQAVYDLNTSVEYGTLSQNCESIELDINHPSTIEYFKNKKRFHSLNSNLPTEGYTLSEAQGKLGLSN
jgi:hypothetical protein